MQGQEVLIINQLDHITIAPGEGRRPLGPNDKENQEELCFPTIFAGHILDTDKKLSYSDRVKWECRNVDRRSCKPTRLLYMVKRKLEESVHTSVNISIRKIKNTEKLTAGDFQRQDNLVDDMVRQDDGYRVFKNVRGTPAFWQSKRSDILGMVGQLGVPTFFMTFTISETRAPELLAMLHKLAGMGDISCEDAMLLDDDTKSKLIRDDPVTVARYTDALFKMYLDVVCDPKGSFGEHHIIDYYVKVKFQKRGSDHWHLIVYAKNAPPIDLTNANDPAHIEFIDQFITCRRDTENPFVKLVTHRHSRTCKSNKRKTCRFHYPLPVMPRTMVLLPIKNEIEIPPNEIDDGSIAEYKKTYTKINSLMKEFFEKDKDMSFEEILEKLDLDEAGYIMAIRSSLKQPQIFLRRGSLEVAVNAYNVDLLNLLESNMDIQYIINPYACITYITNYITKIENGLTKMIQKATEQAQQEGNTIKQKLTKVANVFLRGYTMGAQEGVHHALSLPLSKFSRATEIINTHPMGERTRMLKTKDELACLDEGSVDIYRNNIQIYYSKRMEKLENICLAVFVANYPDDVVKQRKKYAQKPSESNAESNDDDDDSDSHFDRNRANTDENGVRLRKKSKILKYTNYKKETDPANFYREQIMLYLPWRNKPEEVEIINAAAKYYQNIGIIERNHFKFTKIKNSEIVEALEKAAIEAKDFEEEEEDDNEVSTKPIIKKTKDMKARYTVTPILPDVDVKNAF